MKHLITGSRGFLGTHLMRALGSDAVGVDLPECDVRDPAATDAAFEANRPDTVWHLAAINGTRNFYERPWDVLETQVRGTLNIIQSCVARNIGHLVLFSSSEVYQRPAEVPTTEDAPLVVPRLQNPRYSYGGGKICAELLGWWSAIPRVTILRPHNVVGPGMGRLHVMTGLADKIRAAASGERVDVAGASSLRAFLHVDDFISGAIAAAAGSGQRDIFHIGGDEPVSMARLAQMLASELARDVKLSDGPGADGETPVRHADTSKLRALGWCPRRGLASIVSEAAGY